MSQSSHSKFSQAWQTRHRKAAEPDRNGHHANNPDLAHNGNPFIGLHSCDRCAKREPGVSRASGKAARAGFRYICVRCASLYALADAINPMVS